MNSEYIEKIRSFNRFYTQTIGLIKKRFLDSEFSLIQARVLFELNRHPGTHARDLGRKLDLDPTYLSKILKKFGQDRLLTKTPAPDDSRKHLLSLTREGKETYARLREMSNVQIQTLVKDLSPEEKTGLAASMASIKRTLTKGSKEAGYYSIRSHRPGDIGYVIHRHGVLYAREYGFNHQFDAYVANGMGKFIESFNPEKEHLWIAEADGTIVGSVAIVHARENTAQLRWLIVDPAARRRGIAKKLLEEALVFVRQKEYTKVMLWTIDLLHAARNLYADAGFTLAETKESRVWGKVLNEEKWELEL